MSLKQITKHRIKHIMFVQDPPGMGLVFVAFADHSAAVTAQAGLHNRRFGDARVQASFYPLDSFRNKVYS